MEYPEVRAVPTAAARLAGRQRFHEKCGREREPLDVARGGRVDLPSARSRSQLRSRFRPQFMTGDQAGSALKTVA